MKKEEMIKYLESYIEIYERNLQELIKKYPYDNTSKEFLETRLECYKDILEDFTK